MVDKAEKQGLDPIPDPIPDYGELMTIERFKACSASGGFLDGDGTGYLATKDGYDTGQPISPSVILREGIVYAWATHVMWFNQ